MPCRHEDRHYEPRLIPGLFILRTLFHATVLCLLAGTASAASVASATDPRPRGNERSLQAAVDALRLAHDVPGVAVAVFDRDSTRILVSGESITPTTRFRLGAVGETFVATAVLVLARDGSLSLDDAVLERAPEIDLQNAWFASNPVTIDDLLLHRSGLAQPHFRDVVMPADRQPLLAAINRSFRAARTAFPPGERSRHSALNTAIAAYVAEQAARARVQDIIDPLVNVPLGTAIRLGADDAERAMPHDANGKPIELLHLNLAPAGDWWASARDLARFGRLLLNDGELGGNSILMPGLVAALEGPRENPGPRRRGLLHERPGGISQYAMRGRLPGYRASFGYLPVRDGGFVVLLNSGGSAAVIREFEDLLRGQLPLVLPKTGQPRGESPPAGLSGNYLRADDLSPLERLLLDATGPLRASACGDALCIDAVSVEAQQLVKGAGESSLRNRHRWWSEWRWKDDDGRARLWNLEAEWRQYPAWRAWGTMLAMMVLVPLSVLAIAQLLRAPLLGWRNRHRDEAWLELLPLSLAGIAALAALVVPTTFMMMDLPALARPGGLAVTVLLASIVTPVFAVLALPATLVAWWREHLHAPVLTSVSVLAAFGWTGLFAFYDIVGFQAWNW